MTSYNTSITTGIKQIAIAGAGGIGSYLASFLCDFGLNRAQFPMTSWSWTVFDDDTVDGSNLLHQNFMEDDLGLNKAEIISSRSGRLLKPELRFMTAADFPKFDVVFSCVDSMTFRHDLYHYGFANPNFYWIDGRCSSRNIGLFNSKCGKAKLLSSLSESTERRGCLLAVDKAKKISHYTPVIVAGLMAQTFLNHIRGQDTTDAVMMII